MAAGERPAGSVVVAGDAAVARAVAVLRAGGLVAFPTETVYGLGASALDEAALARLYDVKGRPRTHPVIVHLASADDLDGWVAGPDPAVGRLASALWPGPLTVLVRRGPKVLDAVTGGRGSVGLRVPDQAVARAVLAGFGDGVAAPSANRFGRVSPTTAADVVADLGADVDLVVDGGPCRVGVESTIVDLTGPGPPWVVRAGAVTPEQLTVVLGVDVALGGGEVGSAPGTLPSHYSPKADVVVVADAAAARVVLAEAAAAGRRTGLLAPEALSGVAGAVVLPPAGPPAEFAHVLYRRLREADAAGVEVLVVVPPPAEGLGVAVRDRLARAAGQG